MAVTLPADPSRAPAAVTIHHHGNDASTVATTEATLRISLFIAVTSSLSSPLSPRGRGELRHTVGSIAFALLLCRGSN
jgi:hypothetical protein